MSHLAPCSLPANRPPASTGAARGFVSLIVCRSCVFTFCRGRSRCTFCWKQPTPSRGYGRNVRNVNLRGIVSSTSLGRVIRPRPLTNFVLDTSLDDSMHAMPWPSSLQEILSGHAFHQLIAGAVWPNFLQQISSGNLFNQPLKRCCLADSPSIPFVWG